MALELLPTYQDSKEEAGSAYESSYERAKTELDAAKTELEALRKAALDIRLAATLTDPSLLPSTMTTAPTFDADKVAEEMERLLGMEQAQFSPGATPWLIGGLGAGYAPPTSSEMLPNMLLSSEAQAFVKEHKDLYTTFNVSEFPQYGLWLSISRWGTDWALINITGHAAGEAPQALPFFALWDEGDDATQKNAPRPTMVPWLAQPRSDVWVPWLGCRCSWPVTQQCWFFYFSNVQAIATLWMTVLCIFLWGLLEGLIVKDFIAKVPDKITFWVDYATHPTPLSTRICMFLIFTVFPFYVVAFVSNGNKLTENYYAGLYQLRVMLRSLASRPEAGTYAYCTLAYWTILTEIWTVIIPAYLPFLCPIAVQMYFEFSLENIAKLYVLFDIVFKNISQYGLDFAMFLLCLKADTQKATTVMVLGKRAALECRSAMFLYLWTLWLFMFLMGVMMKWKLTFLYLWIVPTLWLIYCAFFQGYSYCFAGQAVCPPHTGPLVRCIQVLTTGTILLGFVWMRACFLFPCLCAPTVPGWLFFPPDHPPPSPLKGDIDWAAFSYLLGLAARGFPQPEDCVWEPPAG